MPRAKLMAGVAIAMVVISIIRKRRRKRRRQRRQRKMWVKKLPLVSKPIDYEKGHTFERGSHRLSNFSACFIHSASVLGNYNN